jgi:hypothetical protein
MPRFREHSRREENSGPAGALSLDKIRQVIAQAIEPAHFFVRQPLILEWQHQPSEQIAWEIHQGRLVDPAHTRLGQRFESWNVYCSEPGNRSAEPILSVKLEIGGRQLHVTRAIYCYAWEGYDAGDNVILSRETCKWVCELVGTIPLDCFTEAEDLRDEIVCLLFQAVIGCSRLPLQSVEAPLPAFSLGILSYIYRCAPDVQPARPGPMQSFRDLIDGGLRDDLAWMEKAKLLETLLRSTAAEDLCAAAQLFASRWRALAHSAKELIALCRTLVNEVALSPYTDFIDKLLFFLTALESGGHVSAELHVDFLGAMLRQNARHLTAYDLITFHHRGANYPDALVLDTVLKAYLARMESCPELFMAASADEASHRKRKRIRRRALRQAWLLRRMYEGLPVPDAPTSPGENSRVLPVPFKRVPEEQIIETGKRPKRLFEREPLVFPGERSREIMQQCIADLQDCRELQELGMATFLDRPFSLGKAVMEPDRTLLLSYETFSPSVAGHRLKYFANEATFRLSEEACATYRDNLRTSLPLNGIPILPSRKAQRPGAVALQDAARVAEDFIVIRTTRQAVQAFLAQFDFTALAERFSLDYLAVPQRVLIVSAAATRNSPEGILDVHDANLQRRLELRIDPAQGYRSRAGLEYPVAGLHVLRVWEASRPGDGPQEQVLDREQVRILPRV